MKTLTKTCLFVLGILLALFGAFLMFDGSVLGDVTLGIATAIGLAGIGLITTNPTPWRK